MTISPEPTVRSESTEPVSDYELKIDSQVEKFLETKHKLVYFLVTASIAPIIVEVQFLYGKPMFVWITAAAAIGVLFGLLTAGSAIGALWFEVASYRNHIQYRYARKRWEDLSNLQQDAWTKLNGHALKLTRLAFLLLYLEFTVLAVAAIGVICSRAPEPHGGFVVQLSFP